MVPIVIKFGNRQILIENALHSYQVREDHPKKKLYLTNELEQLQKAMKLSDEAV